jgi:hypothetical protein
MSDEKQTTELTDAALIDRLAELSSVAFITMTPEVSIGTGRRVSVEFRSPENAKEFYRHLQNIAAKCGR